MTDEQRDVRPDTAPLELGALLREVDRAAAVRVDDDRRHALRDDRLRLAEILARQHLSGMGVDVDEPGRDDSPFRIDRADRRRGIESADCHNASRTHTDAHLSRWTTGAVEHPTVHNQDIEGRGLRRA